MTREEAMNHIKYGIIEENYPLPRDLGIEACNFAIDTMRKYRKIEQIAREGKNETRCEEIVRIIDGKA